MPNTKLSKALLKNHLHYTKAIYLGILIVAVMVADVLFTVTEYRSPGDRTVDIELVGVFSNTENAAPFIQTALEAGQAYERARDEAAGIDVHAENYKPALEQVQFLTMFYDMTSEDAYYDQQRYMVSLAANEGDIFIVERPMMNDLIRQGLAVDLTPYIESGIIDPGDRDLSRVTYPETVDDGQPATGKQCIYALQTDPMAGLWNEFQYDFRDRYMVLMVYSDNVDTSAAVMQSLIEQFEVPLIVQGEEVTLNEQGYAEPDPAETVEPTAAPAQ